MRRVPVVDPHARDIEDSCVVRKRQYLYYPKLKQAVYQAVYLTDYALSPRRFGLTAVGCKCKEHPPEIDTEILPVSEASSISGPLKSSGRETYCSLILPGAWKYKLALGS